MSDEEKRDVIERAATVKSRPELIEFIRALSEDAEHNLAEWENHSLSAYFESMAAWLEASPLVERMSEGESAWTLVAKVLLSPKYYE